MTAIVQSPNMPMFQANNSQHPVQRTEEATNHHAPETTEDLTKPSHHITLRAPSMYAPTFPPPTPTWLSGTWQITHSTLPFWKDKLSVSITYTLTTPYSSSTGDLPRLDDCVTYHDAKNRKPHQVSGRNTLSAGDGNVWDWRGKGLIKAASSRWDILGWGGGGEDGKGERDGWMVAFFVKNLFAPAAVQVYSRDGAGLSDDLLREIKKELEASEDERVRKLAGELYAVKN